MYISPVSRRHAEDQAHSVVAGLLEIVPLQIKEISVEYMLINFSKAIKLSKIWSNSHAAGKRHILKMEHHYSTKFYNLAHKTWRQASI